MKIKDLKHRPDIENDPKIKATYSQFNKFLNELIKRKLPETMVISINKEIEELNLMTGTGKELKNQIKKKQCNISKALEKELKIVSKNHYRNYWMAVGMAAFGVPFGVVFGSALGNMGYIGIGIPIGMAIGIAVGTGMDKKVFEEGRQLNFESKN